MGEERGGVCVVEGRKGDVRSRVSIMELVEGRKCWWTVWPRGGEGNLEWYGGSTRGESGTCASVTVVTGPMHAGL